MLETISILATAAPAPDTMIAGSWVKDLILGIIAVILTGGGAGYVCLRKGKRQGREEEKARMQGDVTIANQPITIRPHQELATSGQVKGLKDEIDQLEVKIANERKDARDALGKIHARLDDNIEELAEMKGQLNQINGNVRLLLEQAISKPRGRTGG